MATLISLLCLLNANFKQTAYFPHGTIGWPPCVFDANHNGIPELYMHAPFDTGTMVYEHQGNNQYTETKLFKVYIVGLGNGDNDSLTDACSQSAPYGRAIGVWESRSYNSYPDSLVWSRPMADTELAYSIGPDLFVDFDQDGKMNLIAPIWPVDLLYFENTGDNFYALIDSLWLPSAGGPWEMVVGDFDYDSLLEMIGGDIDGKVYIWENTAIGVDSFQLVWTYQLPAGFGNAYYTAKGNDMDGDGGKEFIVAAFAYNRWCFTMFETNGNNSYQKVWQHFYYYGGSLTEGDIDCGDVDGDGKDEMVTFGGLVLNVWDCVGPDSFVSIWDRWYYGDLTDGQLLVYDLNQNGVAEIVVSGGNTTAHPPAKTYIYEKQPDVIWIYPAKYDTLWANDTVNLLWKLDETTSLESLRIYISHPLMGCWQIYEGLPWDTTCPFAVPDTQSNMAFKFWVAVSGYLRYDSIVSHPFYIKRRTGIEDSERLNAEGEGLKLEVYPNPFTERCAIKFKILNPKPATLKIYDATGRMVRQWDNKTIRLSDKIVWLGDDNFGRLLPTGVYFVYLRNNDFSTIKKVTKLGG